MSIKISICIPTYNRSHLLKTAIESILSQYTEEIEIVISDNASEDTTEEVVRSYQKVFPRIRYFRWKSNMGADRNFLKAVELSSGEYCWFLGSDDAIKPGAIKRMLKEIQAELDIYLCSRTICDINLNPIADQYWFNISDDFIQDLSYFKKQSLLNYYKESQSLGAVFSYLSVLVFKSSRWKQVTFCDNFINTAYSHVFMLMNFMNGECHVKSICESLVLCRGNNDSFATEGDVKRFLLDIDGYRLLADYFYSMDLVLRQEFLSIIKREHPWYRLVKIRSMTNVENWFSIKNKLLDCGVSENKLNLVSKIGVFKPIVFCLLYFKRVLPPISFLLHNVRRN